MYITSYIVSNYNGTTLETNNNKVKGKSLNTWNQNNTLLNNPCDEVSTEIKIHIKLHENITLEFVRDSQNPAKREIYGINTHNRKQSQINNLIHI